jgi:hypothetical protein
MSAQHAVGQMDSAEPVFTFTPESCSESIPDSRSTSGRIPHPFGTLLFEGERGRVPGEMLLRERHAGGIVIQACLHAARQLAGQHDVEWLQGAERR